MNAIELVAVTVEPATSGRAGRVELDSLDALAAALARTFRVSCRLRPNPLDAAFAFDPLRGQYYSTAILGRLDALLPAADRDDTRLLGVAAVDLYVPVLTFVFGEAQLAGRCALVSLHRLREEFYGLPANPRLLHERLVKEALHELGHTFGLRHCPDWRCVMTASHGVERLDVKTADFCPGCWGRIAAALPV